MSGLIPAAGEETFWCPNMLSLMSFAGMTLNKCAVLWIGTLTGGPVQRESHPLCWLKNHIYKLIPEHQYVGVPTYVSFTEKIAFIKKKKKKKKKKKPLPTLPNFFGVLTLNTHIFLFGPTKHTKHFEKNGWTDLCRINPGPRIDPFTSHAQIYITE